MCALPKNFRKNLSILPDKFGPELRKEMLEDVMDNGTFLPRGVLLEDMDASFIEFVNNEVAIVVDGEKIPVIFLTIQRWSEFARTWEFTDKHKDIKMPFITVVRKPDIQPGTGQQSLWNTASKIMYQYLSVPTFDGIRKGVDIYKIPQPIAVDINYEVRMFCNKMRDLNKMHVRITQLFRSRQFYIKPNGHAMPVVVESIGDESTIDDFENRRFYTQLFDMKLQGYISDEDEFEVVPSKNRTMMLYEVQNNVNKVPVKIKQDKDTSLISYNAVFKPFSKTSFTTVIKLDIKFIELAGIHNLNSIEIKLNNNVVSVPFTVTPGDKLTFSVTKQSNLEGRLSLNGNLI